MPHKLSEPLSEEELAQIEHTWNAIPNDRLVRHDFALRFIATIRQRDKTIEILRATLNGVVDIVLKEAEHDQTE